MRLPSVLGGPRATSTGQYVLDHSFELGHPNPYWAESSTLNFILIDRLHPHAGVWDADICGYDNCNDLVEQAITAPLNVSSATLTFWYSMGTQEPNFTCADEVFVGVSDAAGNFVQGTSAIQICTNSANYPSYQSFSVDETSFLQGHEGQTVKVFAWGITDAVNLTQTFIDDVNLTITTLVPAAAVTPSSLTFFNQPLGTFSSRVATLNSTGAGTLHISNVSLSGPDASAFSLMNGCGATLGSGANCPLTIGFNATSAGTRSASLTITDDAGTQTVPISATTGSRATGSGTAFAPLGGKPPLGEAPGIGFLPWGGQIPTGISRGGIAPRPF